jgi:DNA-binding CsgD family transcriptional regulator/tetratricopeptide (TPR) repeat protein
MVLKQAAPARALVGRETERAKLRELLAAARAGRSSTLVVRGAAGLGKTALLDDLVADSEGCRLLRSAGAESEFELPFAALHQLCAPLLEDIERLPAPQRDALRVAFGQSAGPRPDAFFVGLAVLTLLSEAAATRPLICVIDDAQWLDHSTARVLAFVARRLQAESVFLLFGESDEDATDELSTLPELRLRPLADADALALLAVSTVSPLDERVRDRIVAESHGNPLALLELPHDLSNADLVGAYGLSASTVKARIESNFLARVEQLPDDTQQLILIGAAEPLGDPTLLWAAAAEIGIPPEAAAAAEAAGLLEIGARITFRHPLLRLAVYRAASPMRRRAVHRALATVTDGDADPDRRTWHRAHAVLAPDEEIGAELEVAATRSRARGGLAAEAAFLARAAELTPDPTRRAKRALAAADAKRSCGLDEAALTLVGAATQGAATELDEAVALRIRGQVALDLGRAVEAAELLLDSAKRLETLDAPLSRDTYLEAVLAASNAGRFGDGAAAAASAARGAPAAAEPASPNDVLLDGLAVLFGDGYAAGAPVLKRALRLFENTEPHDEPSLRGTRIATRVAAEVFDDAAWHTLATRHVRRARELGLLGVLPVTLGYLAGMRIQEGDLEGADALLHESDAITAATGSPTSVAHLLLRAWRGDEASLTLAATLEEQAATRGDGLLVTVCEYARAVLHNGLGHYEAALAAAEKACALDDLSVSARALPELVEAAARLGARRTANAAFERLSERANASGTDLAFGLEAQSRALVSEGDHAETAFRAAIDHLGRTRMQLSLARTKLLYGEWLRRESRRVDAREQLRFAHQMLSSMGTEAFSERARRELLATGETVRRRTPETSDQLTPQETQIARLARDGFTNPEIGAQLFLSPRTVEWHLRKVFTKLEIRSRRDLRAALPAARADRQG